MALNRLAPSLLSALLLSHSDMAVGQARASAFDVLRPTSTSSQHFLPDAQFYYRHQILAPHPEGPEVEKTRAQVSQIVPSSPRMDHPPMPSPWFAQPFFQGNISASSPQVPIGHDSQFVTPNFSVYQVGMLWGVDPSPGKWHALFGLQEGAALDVVSPKAQTSDGTKQHTDAVIRHIPRLSVGFTTPNNTEFNVGIQYFSTGIDHDLMFKNRFISYSLSQSTLPSYGIAASLLHRFNSHHSAQFWIHNGWKIVNDETPFPNFIVGHEYAGDKMELKTYAFFGPETPDPRFKNWRGFGEVMLSYELSKGFAVGGAVDLGFEGQENGALKRWNTLSTVLSKDFTPRWATAIRAERNSDPDGIIAGVPQTLSEISVTQGFKLAEGFDLRGEYRFDRLVQNETKEDRHTFMISVVGGMRLQLGRQLRSNR